MSLGDGSKLEGLTKSDFEPFLGEAFAVDVEGAETFEIELVEAARIGSDSSYTTREEPFAVVYRGPHDPLLQQGMYRLNHEGLGEITLFLVPVGPDDEGMRYEAVFN